MTQPEWDWKVPVLAESRWSDLDNIANTGQNDPGFGVYCERDHELWLVGSLSCAGDGRWQMSPFYPTGDGRLVLVMRNVIPSLTKLHGDQPFRIPDLDLPLAEWMTALEAGRMPTDAPELTAEEVAHVLSLPTADERHVWLNNKVTDLGRQRLTLRCRFCRTAVEMRIEDAAEALDRLAESAMKEISLDALQSVLGYRLA